MISLSISVVTYFPEQAELEKLFLHLGIAAIRARETLGETLGKISLTVVDNSCNDNIYTSITHCLKDVTAAFEGNVTAKQSDRNTGFGAGHNSAMLKEESTYHLVLNPDVVINPDALLAAIRFMQEHCDVALLAPKVLSSDGQQSYLCKRYPSVFDLVLRGFAPDSIKRLFRGRLAHYEMRDITQSEPVMQIPITSGCFMLFRTSVLKRLGGFDKRYYMYFEDFDICMRINRISNIAYVPAVCLIHTGGDAARKGSRHIAMFISSAARFFTRWGWKWL